MGFQVDVDGSACVPARIDGKEFRNTLLVGHLHASKESRFIRGASSAATPSYAGGTFTSACGRKTRIRSQGVAMPYIDRGVLNRRATLRVQKHNAQLHRHAGPAFRDVAPHFFEIDVVRTFFCLRYKRARIRGTEKSWR
jgi:hypothetical protein